MLSTISSLVSTWSRTFTRREEGATAVEYGIMVFLIAVVIIGVVTLLGTQLQAVFQTVVDALSGAGS
ncbi:MAG: Flp family type IVb pilin [Coriobacteriia bacterium]